MALDLNPGDTIRRTALHEQYGGRRQGGISPSRASANVFVITAPDRGREFGYIYDGDRDDGYFHYTGEGQFGDQQMTQGNRAIRDHELEGRELHVFEAQGTELTYRGQFRYHDHYEADAPETGNPRQTRQVIVFRLEQLAGVPAGPGRPRLDRLGHEAIVEIPVEQQLTERVLVEPDWEPYEAERREQTLVRSFAEYLERNGHEVCRLQLWPQDEPAPLFCDVYDKTTRTLFEAKGTVSRPAIRMAIGQLADYARLISPPPNERALLLPMNPRPDLARLAESQGIVIMYPVGNRFETSSGSAG
jgi:hypothetical protein